MSLYVRARIAQKLDGVARRPVRYAEAALTRQWLVVPESSPRFLAAPPPVLRTTAEATMLQVQDARLVGFRSYIHEESGYFIDEELPFPDATAVFAKKHENTEEVEDTSTVFHGGSAFVELTDAVTVEEDVISLASGEPSNYGSWLYRILPKILGKSESDSRPVFVYQHTEWQKGLLREFFPALDVRPHWPNRQYLLKSALVLGPRNIDVFFDAEVLDFYRTRTFDSAIAPRDKIYISRGATAIRPIRNEAALIEALRSRGFHIVDPGQLPLVDQFFMYQHARAIVCCGGSGLFNVVMARNCQYVVDVEPGREWLYAHCNVMRSCQIPHAVVFGNQEPTGGVHAPWTVDVDSVLYALDHFERGG